MEKLPYLKELGVTCLYFTPVFESHSNHRYDTADYSKIDPLLGSEEDLTQLCAAARKLGIRVILDGVFSHTGSDSVYFNREGRYPTQGAYNSQQSPYYPWYTFRQWPNSYDCWWNFDTLPNVNETNDSYNEYINGPQGIVRKWLKAGASGWRLDVADELPDLFLDRLHDAVKAEQPDALILGEVWEDASNKSAYGVRRRYLLGRQLDTVMNYPFRDAILGFLLGEDPARFAEAVETIVENYPPQCLNLLMNHIGTHDTERALTVLGGEPAGARGREWQAAQKLTPAQRETGVKRLKLASLIQYLLPGVPCLYYGDEAGMEGYRDPLQPGLLPLGQRGPGAAGLVPPAGAAARPGKGHPGPGRLPHRKGRGEPAGLRAVRPHRHHPGQPAAGGQPQPPAPEHLGLRFGPGGGRPPAGRAPGTPPTACPPSGIP